MIGKIIKGNSFRGCVSYVLKKNGAEVINANIVGDDASEYARELEFSVNPRPNRKNKVVHIILSLPIHEKLDDETWMNIFDRYLENMGFTNNHYMAVKHSDRSHEHAHIITNQVRLDGSVVSYDWDRIRSQEVIRGIEKDFGLTPVKSSWETDRRSSKTTGQLIQESKTGTPLVKTQIADRVDAALVKTTNMSELIAELNANQVSVRISHDRTGKPSGISYKLDDVSVAGSKIGRIYSLSQVLKRLGNSAEIAQPQDKNVLPLEQNATAERIPKAIALTEIPAIIRANVQPNITMPELIERLKEAGVDAHIKYTRTNKVKGISFSVGNESIPGNELGKEFSFNGLQKYLGVSFDAERDNPKLNRKSIDKLKGYGRSPDKLQPVEVNPSTEIKLAEINGRSPDELRPVEIKPSEGKLAEISVVPEIKPEESKPREAVTILESSTVKPILKTQQAVEREAFSKDEIAMVVTISKETFDKKQVNNKHEGVYYNMELDNNELNVIRKEDGKVILSITDQQNNEVHDLTRLDVERFSNTAKARAAAFEKAESDQIAEKIRKEQESQRQQTKEPDMER